MNSALIGFGGVNTSGLAQQGDEAARQGSGGARLQPGVPQPPRRHRELPVAVARR